MSESDHTHMLLSGATGFLGPALLAATPSGVTAVLRGGDFESRSEVLSHRSERTVAAVRGDITADLWGLGSAGGDLRKRVTVVVNAAALTDWAAPEGALTGANVIGARHAVDVAASLGVPLVHLSSLFAGYRPEGVVPEELQPETVWLSSYERSKCRGEWAVADRAEQLDVPVVIARVGALAGDLVPTDRQRRSATRVPFVRLVHGLNTAQVPYADGARIDITPRDVVAAAIIALARDVPRGITIRNLGLGRAAPTVRGLLDEVVDIARQTGNRLRAVRVPRKLLLGISSTADRFGQGPRAATGIGLRYLASAAVYPGAGVGRDLSARTLAGLIGFESPTPPEPQPFYRSWAA